MKQTKKDRKDESKGMKKAIRVEKELKAHEKKDDKRMKMKKKC